LDPLLGVPVRLDAAALEQKLVRSGRGGYCYEQNLLFMHVLKALGFSVRGLGARVLWGTAEGTVTARAHMLLGVDLGGRRFIANLMAARPVPGRRYALRNSELSVHHLNGPSERRVLRTAAELRATLAGTFGLTLPPVAGLDTLLTRLTAVAA